MAVSILWPPSLPQHVSAPDYSEHHGAVVAETPMDMGPAKRRLLGRRPTPFNVRMVMTTAQFEIFEAFVRETVAYVKRFGFPLPRTAQMVEVRLVPQSDGTYYTVQEQTPGNWYVSFTLEVMP